ncbi:hypothetical protein [Bdellovibrio bacteriovorus]|uniref:hypothetical protein n=1 Tax=Bdellovibrio bacteriovorus TaxID=959 RepID=UPI003AA892E0
MKWAFILVFFVSSMAMAEQSPLQSPKPVVMGLPFHVKRIKAIMQYQDFINQTMSSVGYKVSIRNTQGSPPNKMLTDGQIDAITYDDKTWTEQRDKTVSLSFPIIRTRGRIFFKGNNTRFDETKLAKFKGGISNNNMAFTEEATRRKLRFINTASPLQSVVDLMSGKIDYFVAIQEVGLSAVDSHPEGKSSIVMGKTVFLEVPLYLTFSRKFQSDLPRIESAFRKALTGDLSKYPLIIENLNKEP